MPTLATTDADILRCHTVMQALRPHVPREEFVARVREQQQDGYQLAFIEDAGEVVTVAGYRISSNLHMGRHLYIDDLVSAPGARSRGHGETMLDWLRAQARAAGCAWLDLDSGTHRGRAHAFYFREGMEIASFHFARPLDTDG